MLNIMQRRQPRRAAEGPGVQKLQHAGKSFDEFCIFCMLPFLFESETCNCDIACTVSATEGTEWTEAVQSWKEK